MIEIAINFAMGVRMCAIIVVYIYLWKQVLATNWKEIVITKSLENNERKKPVFFAYYGALSIISSFRPAYNFFQTLMRRDLIEVILFSYNMMQHEEINKAN